ncbi:MAG: hypothetical protein HWE10_12960 [Gammaproteobacteria bacterium]|nr:hypothetical protein [Gammaproteobacteria bacterium]
MQGCATPTQVHLYSKYLSKDKSFKIKETLENTGFDVTLNQLDFPSGVTENAIIYSALLQDPYQLDKLIRELNTEGFDISTSYPMRSGSHKYTKNSMAVLLLPEDKQIITKYQLSQKYNASNCDSDWIMILREDGTFSITGDKIKKKDLAYADGNWRLTAYPYIELTTQHPPHQYTSYLIVSNYLETDQLGRIDITEIESTSKHPIFGNCGLLFGQRK